MQTLRWRRREARDKVQLLKAPQFMQELEVVLGTFPGARILWLRRDLGEVAASSSSLVWHQRRVQSDEVDRFAVGREWLRKTRLRERRALDSISARRAPTIAVEYCAMNDDWLAEMRRIYQFLGFDLSRSVAERMSREAASLAHKGHQYSGRQFGLER